MNIGQLAKSLNLNVQTIRYYERVGLLKPTDRRASGYRVYDPSSLERLRFIKRAQELGFTLTDIRELLSLRSSSPTSRKQARAKAKERISDIRLKITYLKKLEANLKRLIDDCESGSETGPCPILDRMAGLP